MLVARFFEVWRDDPGVSAERLAERLGSVSLAEVVEFCQSVRRRCILVQGGKSLKRVVADELDLWASRVTPSENGDTYAISSPPARPAQARRSKSR